MRQSNMMHAPCLFVSYFKRRAFYTPGMQCMFYTCILYCVIYIFVLHARIYQFSMMHASCCISPSFSVYFTTFFHDCLTVLYI